MADIHIDDLLRLTVEKGGSDLHIGPNLPPAIRVDGALRSTNFDPLTPQESQRLIYDILSDPQLERFENTKELDFSWGVSGVGRFRVNVYRQRGSVCAAMRAIPSEVPKLEERNLPPTLRDFTERASGLILVTGPTGSGKSTTQAILIDIINQTRPVHIVTIEDPIEYLHRHKMAMIHQRELGTDTDSFPNALRAVLREDPDVVLVGEMRDPVTMEAALTIAETGHLVFATLHTRNAPQTIDRIVDSFPAQQQNQIRILLADTLEAVIAQQLLPRLTRGRIPAVEIMIADSAIKNLIREARTAQVSSQMEISASKNMITMDKALARLVAKKQITYQDGLTHCMDAASFQKHLGLGAP